VLEQLINAIITFLSIFAGVYFASWYFERKIKKYIFLLTGINLNDLIKNRNKEDPLKKLKEKLKS
jgi:hypothetical protein